MSKQTKVDMAFEYRATTSYNPKFTQNTPIPSSSTTSSISAAERMRMKAAEEKEDKKMKEQAAKGESVLQNISDFKIISSGQKKQINHESEDTTTAATGRRE